MACGELVTFNRKNKTAYSAKWRETGFVCGNTNFPWEDNGGALQRRLIIFRFMNKVYDKDLRLLERIEHRELGAFLFKSAHAKRDAMKRFGSVDLLNKTKLTYSHKNYLNGNRVLPPTMIRWNNEIAASMNPLYCLLQDGLQTLKEEPMFLDTRRNISKENKCAVPMDIIYSAYKVYTRERFASMKCMDLTRDIYDSEFKTFGIVVERMTKHWRGQLKTCEFAIGIGSIAEHMSVYNQIQQANLESGSPTAAMTAVTAGTSSANAAAASDSNVPNNESLHEQYKAMILDLCGSGNSDPVWQKLADLIDFTGKRGGHKCPKPQQQLIASSIEYLERVMRESEDTDSDDESDSDSIQSQLYRPTEKRSIRDMYASSASSSAPELAYKISRRD